MGKKSKQNKRKLKSKKTHKRYHQHGGKTVDEYKEEIEKADIFKLDEIQAKINEEQNKDLTFENSTLLYDLIDAQKIKLTNKDNTLTVNQIEPVLQVTTEDQITNKDTEDEFNLAMAEEEKAEEKDQKEEKDQPDNKQVADEDTDFKNKLSKIITDSENLLKNDLKYNEYKAIIEQMKDKNNTTKLKESQEIQELIQTYNTNYKPYVNPLSKFANSSSDTKDKLKSLGKSLESSLGSLGSFFGKKSDKNKPGDKSRSNTTNDLSAPDYTQVQVTPQLLNNNGNPIKLNSDQTAIIIPTNEVDQIKNCIKPILNCDFKEYDAEGNVIKSQPEPSAPPMAIALPIANATLVNDAEPNNSDINPKPSAPPLPLK